MFLGAEICAFTQPYWLPRGYGSSFCLVKPLKVNVLFPERLAQLTMLYQEIRDGGLTKVNRGCF